jgi:hypothetical protein
MGDACGAWHHIVATIDFTTGYYAMYLNGTQLYADTIPLLPAASAVMTPLSAEPLLPGGVLQLGGDILPRQERLYGQQGEFMAGSTSSFALDVFRIYNRSLSAEEIADGVWRFDPSPSTTDALLLDWRFDVPQATVEEDLSGNGNNGRWGMSANLDFPDLYWHATPKGVVRSRVQPPDSVLSPAPVLGARVVTAQVIPGGEVDLILAQPSPSGCTLLSLPVAGLLILAIDGKDNDVPSVALAEGAAVEGCRLRYLAPENESGPTNRSEHYSVDFDFRVESSGLVGNARVQATSQCVPPEWPDIELQEVASPFERRVLLGGVCTDGELVSVEIVTLPQDLMLLSPLQSFNQLEILLEGKDLPTATGEDMSSYISEMLLHFKPLLFAPTVAANDIGAILLVPSPGVRSLDTFLEYRWLSPYADSSVVRRLNIFMEPGGSGIELLPPACSHDLSNRTVDITLQATVAGDDDEQGDNANDGNSADSEVSGQGDLVFQVTRGPYFGTLYQVRALLVANLCSLYPPSHSPDGPKCIQVLIVCFVCAFLSR